MSTISSSSDDRVYKFNGFLGMNENPDGDTKLKFGEASVCRNWKITRDMNLKKRPGTKTKYDFGNVPVNGLWYGSVSGSFVGLAASDDHLWLFYRDGYLETPENLGGLNTSNRVNFFAYGNIVYILNGEEYYSYDGTFFGAVVGYRPLIITSRAPDGSQSTLLEGVNKLNGLRRVWFSPSGEDNVFILPESDLLSIDYVKINATGAYVSPDAYTRDRFHGIVTFNDTATETFTGDGTPTEFILDEEYVADVSVTVDDVETEVVLTKSLHKITFTTAPAADAVIEVSIAKAVERGTNTIEIGYSAASTYRNDVARMTNAELFLGSQDNAVFLYGNGTNKAVYSSVDYWGQIRADYFPDLNEVAVADSNTPITGMIRHYSQMICFKTNSAYSIQYGMVNDVDGNSHWAFYVTPINKRIGNTPVGQVQLVQNNPLTLHDNELYKWENTSVYSSTLTINERQAQRISDRIHATLSSFNTSKCYCYDDNDNQEYYICYQDKALVFNYVVDSWYLYTGISICSMVNIGDDLLVGTSDGKICHMSEDYYSDDGNPIDCYWVSGSLYFSNDYMRKLMSQMWITTKPEAQSSVTVTVQSNKKSEYTERTIVGKLFSFAHMDFENFSFETNRKPQTHKLKIKAKKFTHLNLIFKTDDTNSSATVLAADLRVRDTGYAK